MRKILLTIVAAVFSLTTQAQTWVNQNLMLTAYDGYMFDIETVDANVAWGALWNGTTGAATPYTADYARTIDGGTTWTIGTVTATAGLVISNIWPIDANTCYVAMCDVNAGGGAIYKTTDGGATWTPSSTAAMYSQSTSFCNVVYFADAQNGFAQGDPVGTGANKRYELWTTADGGANWTQVPVANIPALTNAGEYGITNLFSAIGDDIWFATTYGDVYHSSDKGLNWTKSATGLPSNVNSGNRQDISNIAFSDAMHGMVVQVNSTGYLIKATSDGGATWTSVTPVGTFYPGEISGVPGTSVFVCGSSNATYGYASAFSTDYGVTWTDIDNSASHTSFSFVNDSTGFGGEFIAAGNVGGAWKFSGRLAPAATVSCGDPTISSGITTVNNAVICFDSTMVATTNGILAPTVGTVHGFSLIVSSGDISGNTDPNSTGLVLGGTGTIPATSGTSSTSLPNDGTIFPAGVYYLTPIVYGNATGTGSIFNLTLDPNCTYTGNSVMVTLLAQGVACPTSVKNLDNTTFAVTGIYPVPVKNTLNMMVESQKSLVAEVTVKDVTGRVISNQTFTVQNGQNTVSVDVNSLSAGIYTVTVNNGNEQVTKKFVKE